MRLNMLLDMAADGHGDRIVVGNRDQGLTVLALRERAAAAAAAIRSAGSDALVYLGVNGPAFPVALFGAALAGVPLVPLNYRLGEAQLDALLANHPDAYGLADEGLAADALTRAGIRSRTPRQFLESLASAPEADTTATDTDAPAAVIYTSGTSSMPKGVVLRHENLVSYVLGTVEFGAAGPSEAALVSVPPYHIAAVANVLTNLYAGRRIVVLEQFTSQEWLSTVQAEDITTALVVPTMLGRILDSSGGRQPARLRTLAYGGAPMPASTIEAALRTWPDVDFVNAYGLTETSSTISVLGPAEHRAALDSNVPAVRARLGSAGKVLPAVEVEIRDGHGGLQPAGESGRIFVRGEQVAAEYAGTGNALDARGFFDTRDEGYLDSEGYLFLGGRADDTIIRGAENIAPAEIEDVLLEHGAVADAVVLGVPDEEWGQRIEAAIVVRPGSQVSAVELQDHVRRRLRSSKTPTRIVFSTELPRTETGKVIRRRALELLVGESPAE